MKLQITTTDNIKVVCIDNKPVVIIKFKSPKEEPKNEIYDLKDFKVIILNGIDTEVSSGSIHIEGTLLNAELFKRFKAFVDFPEIEAIYFSQSLKLTRYSRRDYGVFRRRYNL